MEHGKLKTYNHDRCRCKKCKAAMNEYTKQRAKKRLERIWEIKSNPCSDCEGMFPPWVMQFDHRPGEEKKFRIAVMATHSWSNILEEIDKCDLVCANCHANRTYLRKLSEDKSTLTEMSEEALDTCSDGAIEVRS